MNKSIIIAAAIFALSAPAYAQQQDSSSVITASPASEENTQLNLIGRVQTKLKEMGLFTGDITGVRTNQTTRAIRTFQRAHNLHVNGDLNDETRTALGL